MTNIILQGKRLNAFSLRWGKQQGLPLSVLWFATSTLKQENFNQHTKARKFNMGISTGKEETKLSLFAEAKTVYPENLKESSKKKKNSQN